MLKPGSEGHTLRATFAAQFLHACVIICVGFPVALSNFGASCGYPCMPLSSPALDSQRSSAISKQAVASPAIAIPAHPCYHSSILLMAFSTLPSPLVITCSGFPVAFSTYIRRMQANGRPDNSNTILLSAWSVSVAASRAALLPPPLGS
eukprot:1160349-Pelagomonas_calceolata.AAC.8